MSLCKRLFTLLAVSLLLPMTVSAADTEIRNIEIGYLQLQLPKPPLLSNILPDPDDSGLQGARVGISDNNAGGRFLGLHYDVKELVSTDKEALFTQGRQWADQGIQYLVVNLPAAELTTLAQQLSDTGVLLFNAGSPDDSLRISNCSANVLHTLPSRAMLGDALAQWLISKKLKRWLLITGTRPEDKLYADAIRRAAKRFGGKIVAEKDWTFDSDLRRSAQAEVPLFTQTTEYDVVIVADEKGDFGEYVLYNTWYPRPVVGTQGLTPVAWHRAVEQWGAAQLQSRFEKQANRWMNSVDYAAWAAVRTVGEALSQGADNSGPKMRNFLLNKDFQFAGFKGRKLTFRDWNGQMRQPIELVQPRALISQSPQEGYLHPTNELDTLGYDKPESQCRISESGAK
ncbi:ABC transporter substrate-binding protein [Parathalassolituus penaei]|uniref:ABC transporter substrate-binding protein n=1 Tax=Parathalassolituus penaei TaxID=2997323 RepID=A0A9X3EA27_9GAMM|nr:ABC transporter substrate-binding protein [Parathalassolituus penaei]MCY0963717.1 ABC transporter substrate-binding protein [Parathalassolituus penaei]